jgi:hypothetical protein
VLFSRRHEATGRRVGSQQTRPIGQTIGNCGKTLSFGIIGETGIGDPWRFVDYYPVATVVCESLMEIGCFASLGTSETAIRPRILN